MKLEINENIVEDPQPFADNGILVTPPISESYWLARVPVSKKQAVVCFPKFNTIGIGFQREEDWNTNLPYTCSADEIYDHIKCNLGSSHLRRAKVIEAIEMIQAFAASYLLHRKSSTGGLR